MRPFLSDAELEPSTFSDEESPISPETAGGIILITPTAPSSDLPLPNAPSLMMAHQDQTHQQRPRRHFSRENVQTSERQPGGNRMEELAAQTGWMVSPQQETTESAQEHSLNRHGSSSNGSGMRDSLVMTSSTLNRKLPWVLPPIPKKADYSQELGERTVCIAKNCFFPVNTKQ